MVAGAACVARGYPACISTNPFFPYGVFCSSLNTGLCSVFSVSIFHPVSSRFTWVLTLNFFSTVALCATCLSPSPAPGFVSSTPCDSVIPAPKQNLSLCTAEAYPSAGSHPTPRAVHGNPAEPADLLALWQDTSGWLGASARGSVTQVAQRVLQRGLAESRAQGGLGVQDSMGWQGWLHIGEGVLPIPLGAYPHPEWDRVSWRGPRDFTGES